MEVLGDIKRHSIRMELGKEIIMSDQIQQLSFKELLLHSVKEYRKNKSLYYVPVMLPPENVAKDVWIGPAAGPHTQLAQNILAAYAGGGRYFELKTVQVLDGKDLGIIKPCIFVSDEAYNTEWSSELTAYKALEEYVKAWILLKLLVKEFSLGDVNGFVFNMSVGYNLEGIKSEKIDYFIESMKEAKDTSIFKQCIEDALGLMDIFHVVTKEDILGMDSCISNTITLSTMHGCPAEEIEEITHYLLAKKQVNTYLKCNPTLLGENEIKSILEKMGYGYIEFSSEIFHQDISLDRVVELISKLYQVGKENQRVFGIKLTNTFPVKIKNRELPGEGMYMSGPPLYLLSISVAAKLSQVIHKEIPISYSGGADEKNISDILDTGIHPVTVSTLLLKRGGYKNLSILNKVIMNREIKSQGHIDGDKLVSLWNKALKDSNYYKPKNKQLLKPSIDYTSYCAKCNSCIDVCPNRANFPLTYREEKMVLHKDGLCNECGNCTCFCIVGHVPYKEKFTLFDSIESFCDSDNSGAFKKAGHYILRVKDKIYEGKRDELNMVTGDILKVLDGIETMEHNNIT